MTHTIHPSVELNIKMGGTMRGVGVERGQREDRGLVARENFMEKVELDTNMHL